MRARRAYLNMTARIPIINSPPANSAATTAPPSRTSSTMPSSKTRLVLANSKRMALARLAPRRNSPREMATAAYEQLELAAPNSVANVTPRRSSLPSVRMIACLDTTVCTIAEITKPSVSGQRTSQNMKKAICSASQISLSTNTLLCLHETLNGAVELLDLGLAVTGPDRFGHAVLRVVGEKK